mmetsp:Transcript_27586/g.46653  ORF Transcript_27586/g.46653 Transcript_27586/m.46653 type:complete len:313 (-) Transcript_27586:418-1356(-)
MSIRNHKLHASSLWEESANAAIIPSRHEGGSSGRNGAAGAGQVWDLDAQEFLAHSHIPYTNVSCGRSHNQVGTTIREGNIIDRSTMTGHDELGTSKIGLHRILVAQGSAHNQVSRRIETNGRNGSSDISLAGLDHVHGRIEISDGTVTSTHQHIGVASALVLNTTNHIHSFRKTLFGAAHHSGTSSVRIVGGADVVAGNLHLDHITCLSSKITKLIIGIDRNGAEDSSKSTHLDFHRTQLGKAVVNLPHFAAIVASRHNTIITSVQPCAAQCGVGSSRRTAQRLTTINVPDHQRIIILSTQSTQVVVVARKS